MSDPFDPYRKWLGIPPKDQPPNHYRLLAVELFEDDPDIISNAADRLMAHVRTFQSGPHAADSQKLLNELAAARHCLLDAAKKGEYDQALRNRLLAAQAPAPAMATRQPAAPQLRMSEPFDPYRKWLGIPPKDQPPNHYRLLAVELFEDDPDIISNAADRLMAHVRTFQTGQHAAASQKLLNELAAARHCLMNVAKKGEYDQALRSNGLMATLAPAPAPAPVIATPQPIEPQQPEASNVSTTSPIRGNSAWPALVAVAITAALLLISGHYIVQLHKRPSLAPATPLAFSANAPSIELVKKVEPHVDKSPPERASEPRRETAADRNPASRPQGQPDNAAPGVAPAELPHRVVETEQPLDLGALVGKMAVGSVDLLKLIKVERDAVKGEWLLENGRLISPAAFVPRLAIPYRLPPEYIFSAVVERIEGENSFGVGLVAGDSKAAALLDGWYGKASGLDALDGQSAENNASTRAGRVLRDNQPNTLVCNVTKDGIRVTVNGESIIDFQGDFDRLSWPVIWGDPLAERLELIGSDDSRFAISKLELTVVSDPANVAGPLDGSSGTPNEPAKTAQRRKTSNERRKLGALINGPEGKAPVPERQELAEAERQVIQLFAVRLANASESGQRLLLADKFMDKADESADATAERYVLLKMARDLAAESGGAKVAARAANQMANWFQVDPLELKLAAFAKAGKTASTAQQRQELFDAALNLVDDCIAANEYDKALESALIGQAAARALKNPKLTKGVAEKKREVERIAKAFLSIRGELARLDADEDDPGANSAVGKFYFLTKGDWQRGLEHLARGDDPAYKSLAERDLAGPDATEDQNALADGWWELGEREEEPARKALFERAGYWYRQRLLAGTDKDTAQKRIAEAAGEAPAAETTVYLVDLPEANFNVDKNWLGKGKDGDGRELKVNGQLTPKGLFMPPPNKGAASAAYRLNRKALVFTADVGLNFPHRSSSTLFFEVWGDGGLLWRSKPIKLAEDVDHCETPVGKIQDLELRVSCPGDNFGAQAVWVEPRLTPK